MIVFPQIAMTDAILVSSNVAEDDYVVWDNTTDFAIGDYCISIATHTVYRALVANGPGNGGDVDPDAEQIALADPLVTDPDPINWQVISATNRWKAFDERPARQTTNAETIEYDLTPSQIVTGIGFFNLDADSLRILVTDPTDGVVYDQTFDLIDNTAIDDYWPYFFEPIVRLEDFVTLELPPYPSASISITIGKTGGTAAVGQIVFGRALNFGFVRIGPTAVNGLDFSFVQNDELGELTSIPREATQIVTLSGVVDTVRVAYVGAQLKALRGAGKAVWVGDEDTRKGAVAYGFYRDWRSVFQVGDRSILDVEIQEVV